MPHVDRQRVALTGGVAVGLHAAACGSRRSRSDGPEHDVDLVALQVDAVRPTVTRDFLVSHYHLPQPEYPKFLLQLVDPSSGVRVDVFPDTLALLPRAQPHDAAGISLLVLDPRGILDHKLAILARASPERPVDEKHYRDAVLLGSLCDRLVPPVPSSHLQRAAYSQDIGARCDRCEVSRSGRFPLAPKERIFSILGYV
jgi:hypothetical protein